MPAFKVTFTFDGGPWNGYSMRKPLHWQRQNYYVGDNPGCYELAPETDNPHERIYRWRPNTQAD